MKKGEVIWHFDSRIDKIYTADEIASLPRLLQKFIGAYGAWHEPTGLWALYNDNAKYINHSETPVTICHGAAIGDLTAARDMDAHTELTADYRQLCDYTRTTGKFAQEF